METGEEFCRLLGRSGMPREGSAFTAAVEVVVVVQGLWGQQ